MNLVRTDNEVMLLADGGHAIGFILPNEQSDKSVLDFVCSVDKVERVTGLDFFPKTLGDADGKILEASIRKDDWPLDDARFKKRVAEWNK